MVSTFRLPPVFLWGEGGNLPLPTYGHTHHCAVDISLYCIFCTDTYLNLRERDHNNIINEVVNNGGFQFMLVFCSIVCLYFASFIFPIAGVKSS